MSITETGVRDALRRVIDPELGINVVDLGLVYGIEIGEAHVRVVMTMTSPACPLGDYLKDTAAAAIEAEVAADRGVEVVLVSEPPWTPDMMTDEGRRELEGGG